jgi:hypothetical protein
LGESARNPRIVAGFCVLFGLKGPRTATGRKKIWKTWDNMGGIALRYM